MGRAHNRPRTDTVSVSTVAEDSLAYKVDYMKIQQRASRSWAKTSRLAALPSWTNMVGVVILVLIVAVLAFRALSPAHHTIPTVVPYTPTTISVPSTATSIPSPTG